ncbi:MAG: hypothetical protein M3389_08500, partial [Actinomycetota bacterium]|nr:hypothetical protein [Actinomycetota bacterium]
MNVPPVDQRDACGAAAGGAAHVRLRVAAVGQRAADAEAARPRAVGADAFAGVGVDAEDLRVGGALDDARARLGAVALDLVRRRDLVHDPSAGVVAGDLVAVGRLAGDDGAVVGAAPVPAAREGEPVARPLARGRGERGADDRLPGDDRKR